MDPILGFAEFPQFSNFHGSPVTLNGVLYRTVEHAYQAAKTLDETQRTHIREINNPGKAKRHASRIALREGWDAMRVDIMRDLLRQKFSWPHLRRRLLDTGDREIIELNNWGDTFWGRVRTADGFEGENMLGRLLMEVRAEIRAAGGVVPVLVAFDLEATCWSEPAPPPHETIEIGAVALRAEGDPARLGEFQTFIRPTEHAILSDFCRTLTHISQPDVDAASPLVDVLPRFLDWCRSFGPFLLVSWGAWDAEQLREECVRKQVPLELIEACHVNAKAAFAHLHHLPKQCGMGAAARHLAIARAEPAHRAIADARTLADILQSGLATSILSERR